MSSKAFYFITGSSASGKTTLLKGVINSIYPKLTAYYFDEIGIPTIEEMNVKFGGPAQWQDYSVRKWIERINLSESANIIVLDGQARPKVLFDVARELAITSLHITLIECSHEVRRERLLKTRIQPELDNLDMYAWAAYLRGQADALNLEIIDTTDKSIEGSIIKLANSIKRFAEECEMPVEISSK
jgi:energy-coupling factor transporter ATP-binding protein EcfA2